jgi:transcriptional regulator with XRE-family HTH domain
MQERIPVSGKSVMEKRPAEASAEDAVARFCRRVRALRREREWTLEQLAAASGVSRSMLSQVERGEANPTFNVAYRIARAFGLSLGELAESEPTPTIEVLRADDEAYHFRAGDDCRLRTLSPRHLERDVEFYEVRLGPGNELRSDPHIPGTHEFLTVESGSLRIHSGDDHRDLGPGDSAHYPADVPHVIENPETEPALAFLVAIYRPGR